MKKFVYIVISFAFGIIVYLFTSRESSVINLLPFAIHQEFFKGLLSEDTFILIFDILLAILLTIGLYILLNKKNKTNEE